MIEKTYAVLRLHYSMDGAEQVLCPVVLFGAEDTVLVDCGYPDSLEQLEEALRACGVEARDLTKLVLTHQDDDHMGAAAALKAKYPALQVLASPEEAPYIEGRKKNLRLQQAEALQDLLPEERKTWGERFCRRLRLLQGVPVDGLIREGDIFDWGGGCRVLATPGHTPGHHRTGPLPGLFPRGVLRYRRRGGAGEQRIVRGQPRLLPGPQGGGTVPPAAPGSSMRPVHLLSRGYFGDAGTPP